MADDPVRAGADGGGRSVGGHWFEALADHLGAAYDRYSHTKGTVQEVDHLVDRLGLTPGMRVLDVGCATGRHTHELVRRGIAAHGIDISARFVDLASASAPAGATFERRDARTLHHDPALAAQFDAALCLCQGAFGMMIDRADDLAVLRGIAHCVRPGGCVALTAFNAYFGVRYHHDATFDADAGVAHERTSIRNPDGESLDVDLLTGWFTPRELRLLCAQVGLRVDHVGAVEPGAYDDGPATAESPELLVIATRVSTD